MKTKKFLAALLTLLIFLSPALASAETVVTSFYPIYLFALNLTQGIDGITIRNMAALFRQKLATPYWVTYQYSEELQHQPIHTTTHGGQEFDLVLKGSMRVRVGDHEETLHEGDSIFYKSSTPHGMIAVGGADCTFLAMIMASALAELR